MATEPKTVVLSDIHVSNGAKYSWFLPSNASDLIKMFEKALGDSSVTELVLLGDVFDLWLYPVNVVPWTVSQIVQANPEVTKALRDCVQEKQNVYYISGNHDMGVSDGDLQPFGSGDKQIQVVSPKWYSDKYGGVRYLEHGHAADMFNAPDDSNDTIGGYPLGYFITRLTATAEDQSIVWQKLKELYQALGTIHVATAPEKIALPSTGILMVRAIIGLLEQLAQVDDSEPIRFSESALDNKFTVGDIKVHYGSLYDRWRLRYPDFEEFLRTMFVSVDSNGLDWHAKKLLSENAARKFVLMGHTHHSVSEEKYKNDGCWCIPSALGHSDARPSYVEIVGNKVELISC
jgi:UDP-2,3-diacylglucosamine pyrophosphatase LpxH